jgi:multidrug resistance efflux pump
MSVRERLLRYGLPALALLGAVAGGAAISSNRPVDRTVEPERLPPVQRPAEGTVIGAAGVIEAEGRNVSVSAAVAGPVSAVFVAPGDRVVAGQPLFSVESRQLRAQLGVREADLRAASEAVGVAEASVEEARAVQRDRNAQAGRAEAVADPRAISAEEISQRRFAADAANAQFTRATAEARRARAVVEQARALVIEARTALDLATVRAPTAGTILQANVRPGQYAIAGESQTPLVVMGRTQTLNLRVDVDEADVPRLLLERPAHFSLRGDGQRRWTARFVRVEPLVVGKTNLSGDSRERVDTRVLQVLYAFEATAVPAYAGQQVDAFLPARQIQTPRAGQAQP